MPTREQSARRRLDFQNEARISSSQSNRPISRSASISSNQLQDTGEIVSQESLRACIEFYETAQIPEEVKSLEEADKEKHASDVRALIAQGMPQGNSHQYAKIVRDQLVTRLKRHLSEDSWLFPGASNTLKPAT